MKWPDYFKRPKLGKPTSDDNLWRRWDKSESYVNIHKGFIDLKQILLDTGRVVFKWGLNITSSDDGAIILPFWARKPRLTWGLGSKSNRMWQGLELDYRPEPDICVGHSHSKMSSEVGYAIIVCPLGFFVQQQTCFCPEMVWVPFFFYRRRDEEWRKERWLKGCRERLYPMAVVRNLLSPGHRHRDTSFITCLETVLVSTGVLVYLCWWTLMLLPRQMCFLIPEAVFFRNHRCESVRIQSRRKRQQRWY